MIERPKDTHQSWAWDIAAEPWNYERISIESALKAHDSFGWEYSPALIERAKQFKIIKEENDDE